MRLERTEHGFNFGAAEISATCSNDKKGWAILTVETPKERLQIYVTKTGKVRVWNSASKELDIQGGSVTPVIIGDATRETRIKECRKLHKAAYLARIK